MERFSDGHGIVQEGPIVPTESMSLGLKVETNGPGLPQLGSQPISKLIGLGYKKKRGEPFCWVVGFVVFLDHL